MLMRTLKMTFWVYYDHLGKLLVANLVCVCALLVPIAFAHAAFVHGELGSVLWVSMPLVVIACVVLLPILHVGLLWLIKELLETRDGSLKTFFAGMRKFGGRAVVLAILFGLTSLFLLSSIWFYGARISASWPLMGYTLSAAAAWAQLLLLLMATLTPPALVNKDAGVFNALKMALVLVVDNPVFAFMLFVHAALLMAFSLFPPVLLFCSFAPLAALQGSAYEILSRKYAAIRTWRTEGQTADKPMDIDFGDDNDEYLCRGFRDLLFPWKE